MLKLSFHNFFSRVFSENAASAFEAQEDRGTS